MKVLCKQCGVEISNELEELFDKSLLKEEDGRDFVPKGYFFWSDGEYITNSDDKLIINKYDLKNSVNYTDPKRLNGCCGLDGMDGINKTCNNGHEVGKCKDDYWMAHCVIFDSELIIIEGF